MRLIHSRFLAATTLTLLTLPQLTWAWTKDYSYEHKMGDNDSRNLAKEAAVEQIKLKAAQEAGTYIQGTTTLSNGQLEETITQIGASIVKVVVQSDKISVDDTGHQLLIVTANATVDETVMQERIKALREDANKAKLLQQLASENEKLRAEMAALAKQRVQELDSDKLAAIVVREVTLRKDLAANFTSTEQVFKSVVTAINIANQEAFSRKEEAAKEVIDRENEFDKIAAEWELKFFQPLRKPKILKAEVVDMKLSDNGRFYSGKIVIEWQNDPNKEAEQFICQQQGRGCLIKDSGNIIRGEMSFLGIPSEGRSRVDGVAIVSRDVNNMLLRGTFPRGMSEANKGNFWQMMKSRDSLYIVYYLLADKWGGVGESINYTLGDDNTYLPLNFLVNTGVQRIEAEFVVSVDAMKANPLLKVEFITQEQYKARRQVRQF